MTTPTPDDGRLWAVTVTIPADQALDRDVLYDAITDAAYDWEPEVRDGWDIDVSAGPVAPCPYVVTGDEGTSRAGLAGNLDVIEHLSDAADRLSDEYGVLATERDRLAAEVAALRTAVESERRISAAGKAFHDLAVKERDYERTMNDRLTAEVAALRTGLRDLAAGLHRYDAAKARRMANAWGGAYGWSRATAEAVATAITTKETS